MGYAAVAKSGLCCKDDVFITTSLAAIMLSAPLNSEWLVSLPGQKSLLYYWSAAGLLAYIGAECMMQQQLDPSMVLLDQPCVLDGPVQVHSCVNMFV
jgi:hypothetical protein